MISENMMKSPITPTNPYIAGNPVGDSHAFIGREDILFAVRRVLKDPNQNAITLFGQRRIGKTSLLQYLENQLPQEGSYRTVYFDLQDRAAKSLEDVLVELAQTIAGRLNLIDPNFEENPRQNFHFTDREELSGIFDDMILREVISTSLLTEENKKSAFGRVLANLGAKILNTGKSGQQEPALVNSIASRSKESFLAFADGLPIYRSIKKDDQNKTIFAVGENLSIGLSRQNDKDESAKPDNR
jgi:AAA+ ATPase superfamily predicted ATPase